MLNRTIQPPICRLEQLTVLKPQRIVMPNGVLLNVLNIGDNEVVRIDLLIEGGRWQQKQPLQALFTNRMLREGTRSFTAAQIAEKLDYYGAWLDLSSASEYGFITLYSLNKYLPETLHVLESMVKEPLFPEEELKVVINNNIHQFQVNSSKVDFQARRGLIKAIYGAAHPCGKVVEEHDYHCIDRTVLQEFYDQFYHSSNCTVYLSGKVSDDCLRQIEAIFGTQPFGNPQPAPRKEYHQPVSLPQKRVFIERADAMQSAVYMGMLSLDHTHPDYLKTRVLITLFGGYFGSRLMSNIREEKGYTYGISAGIAAYPQSSMLTIAAETANESVEPLINEVYHEIDKLQQELTTQQELSIVKNYMLGDVCRSYESAFSLADAWIFIQTAGLEETYFDRSVEAIKSVTPNEIRELAQRHLCKETLKEVVSGKKMS